MAVEPKFNFLKTQPLPSFILKACIIIVLIVLVLFAWDLYQRTYKPLPQYYAINDDKAYKMTALNQPNLTTNAVLRWATNAATSALTFNFYNYPQVLHDSRRYFTPEGYKNFIAALNAAGTIETVVKKQLAVYAVLTDTPIVLKEGDIGESTYAWQIQFPMLLTYESERENKQNIVLTLIVARVPTSESVTGIGIASFIVQEATRRSK
jgi:intracellular multiplication protein IcmL